MSNTSKNKSVREELERIYGKHCMLHEGIYRLKRPISRKIKFKGKSIATQITLHHLVPRSEDGETSIENGALLCRCCHDWLEQLPKAKREKINKKLQEYKMCEVEYVNEVPLNIEILPFIFTTTEKKKEYNRAKKKAEERKITKKYQGEEL